MVCAYHFAYHEDPHGELFPNDSVFKNALFYGSEGVYVFFVISGFIIPYALMQSKFTLNNYFRFLLKRFIRLHPPYVLSMLLTGLVVLGYAIWYWKPFEIDFHRIAAHLLFIIPWSEKEWFNAIYWTLALEFQYYIVIALIFPLLVRNKWSAWITLAAFMLSGIFIPDKRIVLHFAPVFAMGVALFLWKEKIFSGKDILLLAALAILQTYFHISPATAITISCTTLVIAYVNWESRLTNWLGEISYSVYLTHGFSGGQLLYFTARYVDGFAPSLLLMLASMALSVLFAWLFWYLIEVPSIEWSKQVKYKNRMVKE
jgi:peptidoglycan/LPS O-acetylase OafA/YrhL